MNTLFNQKLYVFILVSVFSFAIQNSFAGESYDRVTLSFTLSGHLLIGVGYEHGFNCEHALHFTTFPLILSEDGFPFSVTGGYKYYFSEKDWRPNLGVDFCLLVSPPAPDKRQIMPLLMLKPGIEYDFNYHQSAATNIWLARFLKGKKHPLPLMPIGLQFEYGYTR